MQDWIAGQLAAGLPAFAGSSLAGTVAIKQEAINEFIANWLAADGASSTPAVDPRLARAAIKSAAIRAEPGRILIDIEVRV